MKVVNYSSERPEPGISSSYGHGWEQMKKYFLPLVLIMIVLGALASPLFILKQYNTDINFHGFPQDFNIDYVNTPLEFFGLFYSLLVLSVAKYGAILLYIKVSRGEEFEISEIFIGFKENYLNVVLANLLTTAIIAMGFMFCIIPGIILACRLAFVPYLVMDKKMDTLAAIENSWKMTKGHGWKIFAMGILAFFIIIGGLICFIIGVVIALMWIHVAFASLYYAVDSKNNEVIEEIPQEEA